MASYATMILGPFFMAVLYSLWSPVKWQEPVVIGGGGFELHAPIAGQFMPTIIFLSVIAIAGYLVLYTRKTHLPPLMIVFCVAALYIGCGLGITCIVQIAPNLNITGDHSIRTFVYITVEEYFMILFPVNFIVLAAGLLRDVMKELVNDSADRPMPAGWLWRTIAKGPNLPALALLAVFPLLGICIALLALFGQQPDAMVKAFTETSDWLLSTKVSPPPVDYEGHYLCTAAAGGHERVVKPQRMGIRQGHRIVVNRQLCVANAFEQLIAERTPRFHRIVRQLYDRHGYPLSKHIRTPFAADITYLLMKPLEWVFLTVLYLFDLRPENRIAKQYLPSVMTGNKIIA
ncbi:MAG: DUF6688 domain-containing protein [Saccharofermentanales bacterium]